MMPHTQELFQPNQGQDAHPPIHPQWSCKQIQFSTAMRQYESQFVYKYINKWVAWLNVSLQALLLIIAFELDLSFFWHLVLIALAFVLADFVNGLVHLYMDQNDHYASIVGPFIASFHLHHDLPRYEDKPLWRVYIEESGSKIWLLFFLLIWLGLFLLALLPTWLFCLGAYFGVLSSVAEVSHYLCHNSDAKTVHFLQSCGILLPKKHHLRHHRLDNVNYAFLNGMTDPLINFIAAHFYHGYQKTTDQHTALYMSARRATGSTTR